MNRTTCLILFALVSIVGLGCAPKVEEEEEEWQPAVLRADRDEQVAAMTERPLTDKEYEEREAEIAEQWLDYHRGKDIPSPDGKWIAWTEPSFVDRDYCGSEYLCIRKTDGNRLEVGHPNGIFWLSDPIWSLDGKRVACWAMTPNQPDGPIIIWVIQKDGGFDFKKMDSPAEDIDAIGWRNGKPVVTKRGLGHNYGTD